MYFHPFKSDATSVVAADDNFFSMMYTDTDNQAMNTHKSYIQSITWVRERISFVKDNYSEMPLELRRKLTDVLTFFALSESIIMDNINDNFNNEVWVVVWYFLVSSYIIYSFLY